MQPVGDVSRRFEIGSYHLEIAVLLQEIEYVRSEYNRQDVRGFSWLPDYQRFSGQSHSEVLPSPRLCAKKLLTRSPDAGIVFPEVSWPKMRWGEAVRDQGRDAGMMSNDDFRK